MMLDVGKAIVVAASEGLEEQVVRAQRRYLVPDKGLPAHRP